ncbi:MAG: thiolase family protein [Deltaproteobacteria bacterium]|jgi:acetyl-CoA acyltransferase|nr:thiolase family protein [Deltaproteobacteria bacterium]MBT6431589.1 thiolase family protein [Deltaproteobacteria bacterium]MBT6491038.1 thiolase family protein [Deltaproteobacteria bacterium]
MAFPLNVTVASAVRTAVGRANKGALKHTRPDDLAAAAMQAAVDRVDGLDAARIDDVILGCAMPEGEQGLNIARNAVFLTSLPDTVPGETINRFCASGLQAIAHAAQNIQSGTMDVVLAGGVECTSAVPMGGNKLSLNPKLVDEFPEAYIGMGHTAERVAAKFGVSREDQDAFAALSHEKALKAIADGKFNDELISVKARVFNGKEFTEVDFNTDECPRPGTTVEGLAKLRPVFKATGTVTAGNASPMNDGAAAAVLTSEAVAEELGLKSLGKMRGFAVAGCAPDIMGIGPIPSIRKLLAQTGLSIEDIDLFEINEAFAAQAVYCQRELGIPLEKLNVNGGAIALGHPLGCTGAKLTATLLHEMGRRESKYGIVSMCIGGGMGAAGLFERC